MPRRRSYFSGGVEPGLVEGLLDPAGQPRLIAGVHRGLFRPDPAGWLGRFSPRLV